MKINISEKGVEELLTLKENRKPTLPSQENRKETPASTERALILETENMLLPKTSHDFFLLDPSSTINLYSSLQQIKAEEEAIPDEFLMSELYNKLFINNCISTFIVIQSMFYNSFKL